LEIRASSQCWLPGSAFLTGSGWPGIKVIHRPAWSGPRTENRESVGWIPWMAVRSGRSWLCPLGLPLLTCYAYTWPRESRQLGWFGGSTKGIDEVRPLPTDSVDDGL